MRKAQGFLPVGKGCLVVGNLFQNTDDLTKQVRCSMKQAVKAGIITDSVLDCNPRLEVLQGPVKGAVTPVV